MEKNNRLIITKLFPPKAAIGAITRPRLLQAFAEKPNWRVALITAPAGYGKTVFMLQAAKNIKQQLIWYQLDDYDNDPTTFLQYLTAGFEQHIPGLEAKITALINNPDAGVREKTAVFINEVSQKPGNGFFLVLDDFHVITDPETLRLVLDLLRYLPGVRFLISGRTPFPSAFSMVLANQEYLKFEAEDLKFNNQEITLLMERNKIELPDTALAGLEQKTGGWAAALLLLTISSNIDAGSLADLNSEEIYNYLFTEVFEQLPPETRHFLTATSVLEDFSPEFCDRFLNRKDSSRVLEYLLNHQLFLTPLNGPQKAYRYHQLFRQFLLGLLNPDEHIKLLQRAGDSAKQAGDSNQAIDYYLLAGFYEEAVQLIVEEGERAVIDGYWQRASRWLAMIPEGRLDDPWLALLKAGLEYCHGTLGEAEAWVSKAIEQFTLDKNPNGLAVAISYKARILFSRGQYLESLKLINSKVVKNLPSSRVDSFNVKSLAIFFAVGKIDLAIAIMLKKLKETEREGSSYTTTHLAWGLCTLYYVKGDYDQALETHQKIIRASDEVSLVNYNIQNIATIYRDRGELDKAFEIAQQSVAVKEKLNYISTLPYAYHELALIHVDRGELKKAEKYYRLSIEAARENAGQHFFLVISLAFLAQCLSLQGRLAEARLAAEEALAEARGQMNYVLAVCRGICGPVLFQAGEKKEGLRILKKAIKTFEKIGAKYPLCLCHGFLAHLLLKEDKRISIVLKSVRKCLKLAAAGNFRQLFLTLYPQFEGTLRIGLEFDIETSFTQNILLRIGRPALGMLLDLANHPDPRVRVRVITLLAENGGVKARKSLQTLMMDEDPAVWDFVRGFSLEAEPKTQPETADEDDEDNALRLQTFGSFLAAEAGAEMTPINWTTKKSRDLLAFLSHQEKPVSRERIIAEFWPNSNPQKGIALFHNALHHLRQALPFNKEFIIFQNGEYQLAPDGFSSDRRIFKEALSNIPDKLNRETAKRVEKALELYRGDYLEELDYTWLINERESLKRMYLDAELILAKYYLEIREYSKALEHLPILAEAMPISEEISSLLMTAYAEIGDLVSVKRCYESLKKELWEELGIDPSLEYRRLYYRLCGSRKAAGKS